MFQWSHDMKVTELVNVVDVAVAVVVVNDVFKLFCFQPTSRLKKTEKDGSTRKRDDPRNIDETISLARIRNIRWWFDAQKGQEQREREREVNEIEMAREERETVREKEITFLQLP